MPPGKPGRSRQHKVSVASDHQGIPRARILLCCSWWLIYQTHWFVPADIKITLLTSLFRYYHIHLYLTLKTFWFWVRCSPSEYYYRNTYHSPPPPYNSIYRGQWNMVVFEHNLRSQKMQRNICLIFISEQQQFSIFLT